MASGVLLATLAACTAAAPTVQLHVDRREPVLGGKAFGEAGAYEKLVGPVEFALDPASPENQGVVDLALAPRNAGGTVTVTADFYLLKPVDPAKGNGASSAPWNPAPSASTPTWRRPASEPPKVRAR